ncbi:calpain-1 catalytic subunit-like [Haliotis rubra]|uniref:calpain-1 catalytic subunit-like n=1 Tax=Haliotis rubra TaxID=36100 RepID=UPI001EE62C95|nr:calpain-1 catalytic subunit-like [Haliotis rubra]
MARTMKFVFHLFRHYGSYNEVGDEGGYTSDACLTLTGGVTEIISLKSNKPDPHRLFHRLKQILEKGSHINCSLLQETTRTRNTGLIGGHAYSLTDTRLVTRRNGEKVPLLRIRNPQGYFQWKGKWSDMSSEWMTVVEGDKIHNIREDGEFWMSAVDFLQQFSQIMICCRRPDCIADGSTKPMRLAKDGYVPLFLQLVQKTETLQNDSMHCDLFRIKRVDEKTKTLHVLKIENSARNNHYLPRLHTNFRFKLKPGRYLAVPSTEKKGINKEFLIRVFCASPVLQCR